MINKAPIHGKAVVIERSSIMAPTLRNQQNPPLPKKKRVDSQGNDRRRFVAKSGNATLILASGLTKNACEALETSFRGSISNLGGTCECSFLIIR